MGGVRWKGLEAAVVCACACGRAGCGREGGGGVGGGGEGGGGDGPARDHNAVAVLRQPHHIRQIKEPRNKPDEPRRGERLDEDNSGHIEVGGEGVQQLCHRRLGDDVDIRVDAAV